MKFRVKPAQNVELALAESFEKTIKSLQKEGLFENVSSFDLNFTGRGINIKLNESLPGNRNVSHRYKALKASNLRENESDNSKYPFTDLIFSYIRKYYDLVDFWPGLRIASERAFYDEVSDITGADYETVKDNCWQLAPDTPYDDIFNELVHRGSEEYLSGKYGTLENLQKVIDEDNADTENACEEFADNFDFLDYGQDIWAKAIDTAVSFIQGYILRDEDDDDEYYGDD